MAKSNTTDVLLGVLGVLGVATLAGATAYAGVCASERLYEERLGLLKALDKLENKRIRDLTTREVREMRSLQDRLESIEEALGL